MLSVRNIVLYNKLFSNEVFPKILSTLNDIWQFNIAVVKDWYYMSLFLYPDIGYVVHKSFIK